MHCVFCQTEIEVSGRVGSREVCPKCGRDLHSCLQCRFYDEDAHHECKEPQAEWVEDKDRANYCEWFEFGRDAVVRVVDKDKIKAELDKLFRK